MYSLLLSTLVTDPDDLCLLFFATETIPPIKAKAAWCMKWIEDQKSSFTLRLIAFAAVEGIFFSSSFASIFWLKKCGSMPGLCFSNELISRDEALHTEFACALLRLSDDKPPQSLVYSLIAEAVDIEIAFAEYTQ
ncbi:hypothetical protein HGRIS_001653 [Hohenbuehelia grisea]|uniref:Uncharacterized protein n=1 Tax=Hohenbuehelia grisea TaxID=104357 RepID=A0ABR3JJT2_9AGAR